MTHKILHFVDFDVIPQTCNIYLGCSLITVYMSNYGAMECVYFKMDFWLPQSALWSIYFLLLFSLALLSPSILGMIPVTGKLWIIMMINYPPFKKILRIYVNYVYSFEYLWQIQSNWKAFSFLLLLLLIMKIFAISLLPWTVFSLSCFCPLSLSFPPFLLHIYSDGPVDTVILKNAFHFRALFFFLIVYIYNLANFFIIFHFSSLNFPFTCYMLELIFLSNSNLKKEKNSSGHNIKSKYVIFFLQKNYWKDLFTF